MFYVTIGLLLTGPALLMQFGEFDSHPVLVDAVVFNDWAVAHWFSTASAVQ